MKQNEVRHIPLHMPNILSICVNDYHDGEIQGEIFHCYDRNSWRFANVMQMMELIEELYNRISFPQAAFRIRTLTDREPQQKTYLEKQISAEEIAEKRGRIGTFLLSVKYRQNVSWQGEVEWLEGGELSEFSSALELVKIISNQVK
ncbi:MAG: hypothetical protein PHQ72_03170 [Hespellia sp.]|nr:hypothetical protein [Hespellia sp.]